MTTARTIRRAIAGTVGAGLVALVGLFATHTLGLVTTHGISMLPLLHTGDLAVIVASGSYHVGEVVAYRSPLLHTVVLHRIYAEHGGLFTFKGDNNHFLDPQRLPQSAIAGRMLLRIPDAGSLLTWLHSAPHLVLIVVPLALLVVSAYEHRRHPGRAGRVLRREAAASAVTQLRWRSIVGPAVAVCLACAIAGGALAADAFAKSTTQSTPKPIAYKQSVTFSYRAAGGTPPTAAYPEGKIPPGAPVFVRLVHAMTLTARYRLSMQARHTPLTGTISMTVRLTGVDGWSRLLAVTAPRRFTGNTATGSVVINLASAEQVLNAVDSETGVALGNATLEAWPHIEWSSSVDGAPVVRTYRPGLQFVIDDLEVSLPPTNAPNGDVVFPQLHVVAPGSIPTSALTPATMSVLGHAIAVRTARTLAEIIVLLALLALGALAVAVAMLRQAARRGEVARIAEEYEHELVEVASPVDLNHPDVIDVPTIDALARLAEASGSLILHHDRGDGHRYFVVSSGATYRYTPSDASGTPTGAELVTARVAATPIATASAAGEPMPIRSQVPIGMTNEEILMAEGW